MPLTVSRVSEQIPITSNISAGAAQQQLGAQATQISTLTPSQVLSGALNTAQFNEVQGFNTQQFILNQQQNQQNAQDSAVQGALNQDKADDLRAEQFEQFQQGLDAQESAQQTGALGQIAGGVVSGILSGGTSPGGSNSILGAIGSGVGTVFDGLTTGVGAALDGVGAVADSIFGDGDGKITIGNTDITSEAFGGFVDDIKDFFTPGTLDSGTGVNIPNQINGQEVVGNTVIGGQQGVILADGSEVALPRAPRGVFDTISQPLSDAGLDSRTAFQGANLLANLDKLTPAQQAGSSAQITTNVLQNKGVISSEQAKDIQAATNAISVLANPNASDAQKAVALANAGAQGFTTSFQGPVDAPTSVGGVRTVGTAVTADGQPGILLENGNIVPQSAITQSSNASSVVQALGVLTSGASQEDKILALSSIGVNAASANDIISQVNGGNLNAVLGLVNTAKNFNDMNPLEQAVAITQTSSAVFNAAGNLTSQFAATPATSALTFSSGSANLSSFSAGQVLQGAGAVAGVALGVHTAANTISAVEDLPRSQAPKEGIAGLSRFWCGYRSRTR